MNTNTLPNRQVLLISIIIILSSAIRAQDIPPTLWGHSMVNVDNELYVYGGASDNDGLVLNPNLWKFDRDNNWNKVTPESKPPERNSHESVQVNNKMYSLFGQGKDGLLNDIWMFDPTTGSWTEIPQFGAEKPVARKDFSAVAWGNGILVSCGRDEDGNNLMDNWYFSLENYTWTKKKDFWPSHCPWGGTSQMVGDQLFLFGGNIPGSNYYNSETNVYNIGTDQLTSVDMKDLNPNFGGMVDGTSGQFDDQSILVGGGMRNEPEEQMAEYWTYDPINDEILEDPKNGPRRRHAAMAVINNKAFLFGGFDANMQLVNKLHFWDKLEKEWKELNSSGIFEVMSESGISKFKAYPVPFEAQTEISFQLHQAEQVELTIYDSRGSIIKVLTRKQHNSGSYSYAFDASDLASGIYYCVLKTKDSVSSLKLLH